MSDKKSKTEDRLDGNPEHPLQDMYFLDGYLSFVYDSDLPDGAWFAALQSTIEEKWPKVDGHEVLMEYLEWKSD